MIRGRSNWIQGSSLRLIVVALVATLSLGGCTMRYSQTLTGKIPPEAGRGVRSSDSGFAFFGIVFSEPQPAYQQVRSLLTHCDELQRVEVDYREIWFFLFSIPKVTVTARCIGQ